MQTTDGAAASSDAAGECPDEELLSELTARINRGEKLTNAERCMRQGLIFNHSGRVGGFVVTGSFRGAPNAADHARPLGAVACGRLFEDPAGKPSGNSKLQKRAE
jgi:hypothetical protein